MDSQSHVTTSLDISGTQPSAVPGDDYDGSGIGLAEVSIEQPSARTIQREVGKKWNAATRSFV